LEINCLFKWLGLVLLVIGSVVVPFRQPMDASAAADLKKTAHVILHESRLPNKASEGYPLPLAALWNTGWAPGGFGPEYQLEMIEQGHYLLPAFYLPAPWESSWIGRMLYYEKALKKAALLQLPISFVSTQWERYLTVSPGYRFLPAQDNPNVVDRQGSIQTKVSPFGPVGHWYEVGKKWTSSPLLTRLQQWYPDPPQVLFVSNNEHDKLLWHEVEMSARYRQLYGAGHDDAFKRKVVGDGWIGRYRALQLGMRDGLGTSGWTANVAFIGYEAFGTRAFGRWQEWVKYSLYTPERFDPWPLAWDGGSVSYYVHNWSSNTDHTVMSPQIEAMNWVFMKEGAEQLNPDFRFEMSVWDGHEPTKSNDKRSHYRRTGSVFTPQRYEGYVQFGMWLLRPRVVREFRNHLATVAADEPYFLAIVRAVDRVHDTALLTSFWRKGRLVANRRYPHPYQTAVPAAYKNMDRWFLLDTNLDPKRPWKLDTSLPVFSLALVIGEKPNRQWLVYAHAPLGPQQAVKISVPDYKTITADVTPAGCFYYLVEQNGMKRLI